MDAHEQDIIKVVVAGTLIVLLLGASVVFFLVQYKRRQSRYRTEKRHMEQHFHQELLRTQIEIQEQTLKNISQEIHDNIGQSLSLAKLNLNTIDLQKTEAAIAKIESSRELVGKAIHDLRDLSKSLNTDSILSAGLIKAIELELSMVDRAGAFQTSLIVNGNHFPIDPKKELFLFRTIQEAVNNIIKHAQATTIKVIATFSDDNLTITINDNGNGFSFDSESDGSGLRNMKSRVELIGGSLNIQTGPEGTTITISTPLTDI
jgi:signal transduction histidine kinase